MKRPEATECIKKISLKGWTEKSLLQQKNKHYFVGILQANNYQIIKIIQQKFFPHFYTNI